MRAARARHAHMLIDDGLPAVCWAYYGVRLMLMLSSLLPPATAPFARATEAMVSAC